MKQCWTDGDLRAYVDGELPAESRESAAAHLAECAECAARYGAIAERAARVSGIMALLPDTAVTMRPRVVPVPVRARRWVTAAIGVAAGLVLAWAVIPKHRPRTVVNAPVAAAVPPPVVEAAAVPVAVPKRRARAARPKVLRADFLRLDDEPLETGTVVRVSAENGDVQADLIVGPDGRAHAVRVVNLR